MKKLICFVLMVFSLMTFAQSKTAVKKTSKKSVVKTVAKNQTVSKTDDLVKLNDSIPALIPQKMNGKFGFVNQKGKLIIAHQYSNVGFFTEDCNLLNSKNPMAKKYGTADFASVRLNGVDFRIDKSGKRVYQYKDSDLAVCSPEVKKQYYHSYILHGFYGLIEDAKFENEADYRQYQIYPQYQYLHILEGDDLHNPMIVASVNDRFGVIDKNNKIVIPFEYSDIKRNFSWKLGRLFEVTKDGKDYFFVDEKNHAY